MSTNNHNKIPWTANERQLLASDLTVAQLVKKFKTRSYDSIDAARRRMKKNKGVQPAALPKESKVSLSPMQKDSLKEMRQAKEAMEKELERESLVAQAIKDSTSRFAYKPITKPQVKLTGKDGEPVSLVGMLSDWHVGLEVNPVETMGQGNYSQQVFMDRIWELQRKTLCIAQASTSPIEEYVACVIGDMVDGMLQHGAEVENTSTVVEQVLLCSHVLAQFLRNMAAVFPKVRAFSTPGNHPRVNPRSKHQPTKGRYSNWDTIVFHMAAGLTKDVPNIQWAVNKDIFQRFEVQNHGVFMSHGDERRGGGQSELAIPLHALGRSISSMAQTACRTHTSMPHLILQGHLHRNFVLPHGAGGAIVCNGAPVGPDTYAIASGFMVCEPSQNLLFVHPKHGMISYHPIYLKDAPEGQGENFGIKGLL